MQLPLLPAQNSILTTSSLKADPTKKLCTELASKNLLESIFFTNNQILTNLPNQNSFLGPEAFSNIQSKLPSNNILPNAYSATNYPNPLIHTSNLPKLIIPEALQIEKVPSSNEAFNLLQLESKSGLELASPFESLSNKVKAFQQNFHANLLLSKAFNSTQNFQTTKIEDTLLSSNTLLTRDSSFSQKTYKIKKPVKIEETMEISTNDSEDQSTNELPPPTKRKKNDSKKKSLVKGPLMSEMDIINVEPYEIKLNLTDDEKSKIKSTLVGSNHQAVIPPLNESKRQNSRTLNEVWNPELLANENLQEILEDFSKSLTEVVDNEQKALKLLVKAGMDKKRVSDNLKKNRAVYRQYFGIQTNLPKSKKKGKK